MKYPLKIRTELEPNIALQISHIMIMDAFLNYAVQYIVYYITCELHKVWSVLEDTNNVNAFLELN